MFAPMDQFGLRAWLRLLALPALAAVVVVRGDGQLPEPHARMEQLLDTLAALPAYMPLDALRQAFPFLKCKEVVPYGSAGDHWCVGRTSGLFVSVTTRDGRLLEIGAQESPPLVLGAWARARHGPPAGTCEHSYRAASPAEQAGRLTYTWWTRRGWTVILSSHPKFDAVGLTLSDMPLASLHCDPGTLRQPP